jgi:hypothetical protein
MAKLRCHNCRKVEIENTERDGVCPSCDELLPKLLRQEDGSYATTDGLYLVKPRKASRYVTAWLISGPPTLFTDGATTLLNARQAIKRSIDLPEKVRAEQEREAHAEQERRTHQTLDSTALGIAATALREAGFEVERLTNSLRLTLNGAELAVYGRDF